MTYIYIPLNRLAEECDRAVNRCLVCGEFGHFETECDVYQADVRSVYGMPVLSKRHSLAGWLVLGCGVAFGAVLWLVTR